MAKPGCAPKKLFGRQTRWLAASTFLAGAIVPLACMDALSALLATLESRTVSVPCQDLWAVSGHADPNAEAFNHWNKANPPQVPASCAKCHSTPGYMDFLGADGTNAGKVDNPAPAGTTIECMACHNDAAAGLDGVVMPSGAVITGLGSEARCMQCHQGLESTVSVNQYLASRKVTDEDAVNPSLGFRNIHDFPAAATGLGTFGKGGYQYGGKSYDARSAHVQGIDTCIDCHDPHSLKVRVDVCVVCHPGVRKVEDLRKIRMAGSAPDYDGDGDVLEGIDGEIKGLQAILYDGIQAYAGNAGTPVAYTANSPPYFFVDTNANGAVDPTETTPYNAFTARLLKAAFNYQFSVKDPGAFAHGGKYMIQLLFDSIEDLDAALATNLTRDDVGHFAGSGKPWRHWDQDGKVPGDCSKCHSATGLPFYLREGLTASQPLSNGMLCTTCHDAIPAFTRYAVKTVPFPSGASLDTGDPNSNLCVSCHQGRQSTVSVNVAIAGLDLDAVSAQLGFLNIHDFAAGATLFGTQAQGAYEYPGQAYQGRLQHVSGFGVCTDCHGTHSLDVKVHACGDQLCHGFDVCAECHEAQGFQAKAQACAGATCHAIPSVRYIRKDRRDFDGDGNANEGLVGEVEGLAERLYGAIQDYAASVVKIPIVYDGRSDPYFFADGNGNGIVDKGEGAYTSWTPRLLRTAYNYQYARKDPGAFAHNGKYIIQVLHDSLADLAAKVPVDMTKMVRP